MVRILQLRSRSMSIAQKCSFPAGQVKCRLRKAKKLRQRVVPDVCPAEKIEECTQPQYPEAESSFAKTGQNKTERVWRRPSYYNRYHVKLIVQGPSELVVSWKITLPRLRMVASYFQSDTQTIQKGLRLYDATYSFCNGTDPLTYSDIYVSQEAGSGYVRHVEAGHIYVADLGLFYLGRFYPILRSEPVAVPIHQQAASAERLSCPDSSAAGQPSFEG